MNLFYGILWGLIAQIITFLQLQGQMRYDILKNNTWFLILMGMPISYMFIQSVKNFILAFNGQIWPSRILGFGIGVIVFSIMSTFLFKEQLTLKTGICLLLGLCIILVQIFWKN
jgi:multidrug transporter EmrE-like cation transporter